MFFSKSFTKEAMRPLFGRSLPDEHDERRTEGCVIGPVEPLPRPEVLDVGLQKHAGALRVVPTRQTSCPDREQGRVLVPPQEKTLRTATVCAGPDFFRESRFNGRTGRRGRQGPSIGLGASRTRGGCGWVRSRAQFVACQDRGNRRRPTCSTRRRPWKPRIDLPRPRGRKLDRPPAPTPRHGERPIKSKTRSSDSTDRPDVGSLGGGSRPPRPTGHSSSANCRAPRGISRGRPRSRYGSARLPPKPP